MQLQCMLIFSRVRYMRCIKSCRLLYCKLTSEQPLFWITFGSFGDLSLSGAGLSARSLKLFVFSFSVPTYAFNKWKSRVLKSKLNIMVNTPWSLNFSHFAAPWGTARYVLDETHLWNSSIGLRYVLRIRNTLCAVGSCLSFLYHIYSSADVKLTLPPHPPFFRHVYTSQTPQHLLLCSARTIHGHLLP